MAQKQGRSWRLKDALEQLHRPCLQKPAPTLFPTDEDLFSYRYFQLQFSSSSTNLLSKLPTFNFIVLNA